MDRMSYMTAIPQKLEDIADISLIIDRIKNSGFIETDKDNASNNTLRIKAVWNGNEYEASISSVDIEIPPMCRLQHFFTDLDIDSIKNSRIGVMVAMEFGDNPLDSYHVQLKIINTILPNAVAVLDANAEKILSGNWVRLAANSNVPPSPKYIYTIQAVIDDDKQEIWLHTHGLNRCELPELEILDSSEDMYYCHSNVITTMASRMLEFEEPLEENEPIYLAMVTDVVPLYAALMDWNEYIHHEKLGKDHIGGLNDRKDSHNENTMVICCFPTPKDLKEKKPKPLSEFDELFAEGNPIFMISTVETARMKALAEERVDYIRKFCGNPDITILLKIGLTVDEEYKDKDVSHEHIWFELKSIDDNSLTAVLTQDPYYVKDMKKGSIGTYSFDKITDWVIIKDKRHYTPDDCYMLDLT